MCVLITQNHDKCLVCRLWISSNSRQHQQITQQIFTAFGYKNTQNQNPKKNGIEMCGHFCGTKIKFQLRDASIWKFVWSFWSVVVCTTRTHQSLHYIWIIVTVFSVFDSVILSLFNVRLNNEPNCSDWEHIPGVLRCSSVTKWKAVVEAEAAV